MRKEYDFVDSISEKALEKMCEVLPKDEFNKFMRNLIIVYQTRENVNDFNEKNKNVDKNTNSLHYLYVEFDKVIWEEILNYSYTNDRIINRYDVTTKEYRESYNYCKSTFEKFSTMQDKLKHLLNDENSLEE